MAAAYLNKKESFWWILLKNEKQSEKEAILASFYPFILDCSASSKSTTVIGRELL